MMFKLLFSKESEQVRSKKNLPYVRDCHALFIVEFCQGPSLSIYGSDSIYSVIPKIGHLRA